MSTFDQDAKILTGVLEWQVNCQTKRATETKTYSVLPFVEREFVSCVLATANVTFVSVTSEIQTILAALKENE